LNSANETANGWGRWMVFLVGALLVASYWVGLWPGAHHFTAEKVSDKLARPLLQLLASLGVGLLVGQAIESLGWAAKLGSWVAPLLRWEHLSQESGASFTAAFFPGILDNTILVTLYQEGRISRQEMTITYLLNNGLPNYLPEMQPLSHQRERFPLPRRCACNTLPLPPPGGEAGARGGPTRNVSLKDAA